MTHIRILLQLAHHLFPGSLQILAEHLRIELNNNRTQLQPIAFVIFGRQQRRVVPFGRKEGKSFGVVMLFVLSWLVIGLFGYVEVVGPVGDIVIV